MEVIRFQKVYSHPVLSYLVDTRMERCCSFGPYLSAKGCNYRWIYSLISYEEVQSS